MTDENNAAKKGLWIIKEKKTSPRLRFMCRLEKSPPLSLCLK